MKCSEFEELLDDYYDELLDAEQNGWCSTHLQDCKQCTVRLRQHKRYMQAMKNFEVPAAAPGKLAHLLAETPHLAESQVNATRASNSGFFQGFAAASVLACVLFAVNYLSTQPDVQSENQLHANDTIITVDLSRDVVVSINVPSDMPAAQLAFELPTNLRVQGQENLDLVAWSVDLQQGANVLRLPLTIRAGTDVSQTQRIAATVVYNNKAKNFDLVVNLSKSRNSRQEAMIENHTVHDALG